MAASSSFLLSRLNFKDFISASFELEKKEKGRERKKERKKKERKKERKKKRPFFNCFPPKEKSINTIKATRARKRRQMERTLGLCRVYKERERERKKMKEKERKKERKKKKKKERERERKKTRKVPAASCYLNQIDSR